MMRQLGRPWAFRRILGMNGFGGIRWLLRDEFTSDADAPLASPRTCEPGPGILTIAQINGPLSIVSGELSVPLPSPIGYPGVYAVGALLARKCGRALYAFVNFNSHVGDGVGLGFNDDATPDAPIGNMIVGVQFGTSSYPVSNKLYVPLTDLVTNGSDATVIVIMRSTGMWLIHNNNLEWVGNVGTAGGYPCLVNARASLLMDEMGVLDLSGAWASQWGPATAHSATPTTGDVLACNANGTTEITWTPAEAETLDLMVRRTDDDNCWIVRCDQAAGTIKLYENNTGSETERTGGTTTQTWTAGTAYRVVVKCVAASIRVFTATAVANGATKNVYTSATFNQTVGGSKASGFTAAVDFATWPYEVTAPLPFDRGAFVADKYYATVGDSKTWVGEYQQDLMPLLNTATSETWREIKPRAMAHNGFSVASVAGVIVADLATMTDTPEFVLLNLGSNDVDDPLPSEATWLANYYIILDAIHAKWPSASCYIMRPWRRGYATECDTVASRIDTIVSNRAFAHVGPDERGFLEGGDDGVTYTADGLHPTDAGYALMATEWLTIVAPV